MSSDNRIYKPFNGFAFLFLGLFLLLGGVAIVGFSLFGDESSRGGGILGGIMIFSSFFCFSGLGSIDPRKAKVYTSFGEKVGYYDVEGFYYAPFWFNEEDMDLADFSIESETIKVGDSHGTPVMASCSFTMRVVEPEKCFHELNQDLEEFALSRIQGVLRNTVKKYPYDTKESETSLSKDGSEIADAIEDDFNETIAKYGLEISELAFTELAPAPEIAAAILQKQQAIASVEAKEALTKGLSSVVKELAKSMNEDDTMSKEDLTKFKTNAMLVLLGNQEPTTTISLDN